MRQGEEETKRPNHGARDQWIIITISILLVGIIKNVEQFIGNTDLVIKLIIGITMVIYGITAIRNRITVLKPERTIEYVRGHEAVNIGGLVLVVGIIAIVLTIITIWK